MLPQSDYHPKSAGAKPGWLIAQARTVSNFYNTESTCGYLGWKPKTHFVIFCSLGLGGFHTKLVWIGEFWCLNLSRLNFMGLSFSFMLWHWAFTG